VVGVDDATAAALAKLEQVLPARLVPRVRAVHDATSELRGREADAVDADLLVTLATACRAAERLRLMYARPGGDPSERLVDPLRLVRAGPRWYLVARDVARAAWRTYRVDRVADVRSTGVRADVADAPDPVALVARGMAVGPYPVRARVRVPLPPAAALEVVPRTVGVHEPDGDGTIVEIGGDVGGLARYLAGLGVAVTVLGPPEVRAALLAHAERLRAANF
jgi:predicted DNA-binding transcriptional regulator YafY